MLRFRSILGRKVCASALDECSPQAILEGSVEGPLVENLLPQDLTYPYVFFSSPAIVKHDMESRIDILTFFLLMIPSKEPSISSVGASVF